MELTSDQNTLQKHGHRHTLTIPTVMDSDFGNYTCRASNIHGVGEKNLEVSGKNTQRSKNVMKMAFEDSVFLFLLYKDLDFCNLKYSTHKSGAKWPNFKTNF